MKKLLILIAVLATFTATQASPVASAAPVTTSASAAKQFSGDKASVKSRRVCAKGSNSNSGRCWTLLRTKKRLTVVEAVVLENRTRHKKATMHCSFSHTVSKSVEVGGEVSASVTTSLFKVVEANISTTVHRDVTQTAEAASSAGGDIPLGPGESVVCQRTYGYVVARIRQVTYSASVVTSKVLRTVVPSNLGVRITD